MVLKDHVHLKHPLHSHSVTCSGSIITTVAMRKIPEAVCDNAERQHSCLQGVGTLSLNWTRLDSLLEVSLGL